MIHRFYNLVGPNREPYRGTTILFQKGEFKNLEGRLISYSSLHSLQKELQGSGSHLEGAIETKSGKLIDYSFIIDKKLFTDDKLEDMFPDDLPVSDPMFLELFLLKLGAFSLMPVFALTQMDHGEMYDFFDGLGINNIGIECYSQFEDNPSQRTILEYCEPQKLHLESYGRKQHALTRDFSWGEGSSK